MKVQQNTARQTILRITFQFVEGKNALNKVFPLVPDRAGDTSANRRTAAGRKLKEGGGEQPTPSPCGPVAVFVVTATRSMPQLGDFAQNGKPRPDRRFRQTHLPCVRPASSAVTASWGALLNRLPVSRRRAVITEAQRRDEAMGETSTSHSGTPPGGKRPTAAAHPSRKAMQRLCPAVKANGGTSQKHPLIAARVFVVAVCTSRSHI